MSNPAKPSNRPHWSNIQIGPGNAPLFKNSVYCIHDLTLPAIYLDIKTFPFILTSRYQNVLEL